MYAGNHLSKPTLKKKKTLGPFSKTYRFGGRKRRLRVGGNLKRRKNLHFQKHSDTC